MAIKSILSVPPQLLLPIYLARPTQVSPFCTTKFVDFTSFINELSDSEYNIKLSKKRADVVKNELVKMGIELGRLDVDGKGFEEPVSDNITIDGRNKNRRIEIQLSKTNKDI